MAGVLEIISLCLVLVLCCICTTSDFRSGLIYNKVLVVFFVIAVIFDAVYYGIVFNGLFIDFAANVVAVTVVSLFLFFSHSFAGGDCKMLIVLALLYPAGCYLAVNDSRITLIAALAFAIFAGYCYLLCHSVWSIINKKSCVTLDYVKSFLLNFLKSYLAAMLYISFINSIFIVLYDYGITINVWITRLLCILIALCVGRHQVLKNRKFLLPVVIAVVIISVATKSIPISVNWENYILLLVLLLCQMTIRTTIYEEVAVADLKTGMILATFSSLLMQSSITKGLPGVSTEDLKSRLTNEEIESIRIWAKATRTTSLTIVKKIPFAVFISVGFLAYGILWSLI